MNRQPTLKQSMESLQREAEIRYHERLADIEVRESRLPQQAPALRITFGMMILAAVVLGIIAAMAIMEDMR